MIIAQEGDKIIVSLEFSVRWAGHGFVVVESNGHHGHIEWGPMEFTLIEAFIEDRKKLLQGTLRIVADEMFRTKVWPI